MSEPQNPIRRRVIARHDKRTEAQVDRHIAARAGALKRRLAARPVVRITAARIEIRIAAYSKTLRMKHPETPGT